MENKLKQRIMEVLRDKFLNRQVTGSLLQEIQETIKPLLLEFNSDTDNSMFSIEIKERDNPGSYDIVPCNLYSLMILNGEFPDSRLKINNYTWTYSTDKFTYEYISRDSYKITPKI